MDAVIVEIAETYVRARIDLETKRRAVDVLDAMGLTIADAIRLMIMRVADEGQLPFAVASRLSDAVARDERRAGAARLDDLLADLDAFD